MPALAQMNPCRVSLMMRSPRRRRMRTDSCSTSAVLAAGSSGSMGTMRPSALETTFWVMTTHVALTQIGAVRAWPEPARRPPPGPGRSPGSISPMPVSGNERDAVSHGLRSRPRPARPPLGGVHDRWAQPRSARLRPRPPAALARSASSMTSVLTQVRTGAPRRRPTARSRARPSGDRPGLSAPRRRRWATRR